MLDLAPEVENVVRDCAAREGITVNELVARAFSRQQARPGSTASAVSDDPVWARLNAQIAEVENATPEEVAAANAEYRKW